VWAVATLAFHGGFRIHELLARQESSFDPDFTLLTEDVVIVEDKSGKKLTVRLKSPKEDRTGKVVVVDIHETKGSLCPIRAFENWRRGSQTTPGMPLFRDEAGVPLTGNKLNRILKDRIGGFAVGGGKFTTHSFRSGLASTMANKGLTEDDIAEAGRWSSNAYELYIKTPRMKRAAVAKKIAKL